MSCYWVSLCTCGIIPQSSCFLGAKHLQKWVFIYLGVRQRDSYCRTLSGSHAFSPVQVGGRGWPQALMLGKKSPTEPKREGRGLTDEFLGLEGLPAVWCAPPIETNPQSSWVPTKLGLYKSKVGVYFCTWDASCFPVGQYCAVSWVYTDAFLPCPSQIVYSLQVTLLPHTPSFPQLPPKSWF